MNFKMLAFEHFISISVFTSILFHLGLNNALENNITKRVDSNLPTDQLTARIILRHNTHDVNLVNESVINDIPNTVTTLKEDSIANSSIFLECEANFPILWNYEGDGYPDALSFAETRRNFTNFEDPSTYRFYASVHLVRVKEANTGKYICMKVGEKKPSVYYYLFVTGEDIFLDFIKPNVRAKENDSKVILPCRVTDPKINVYLGKYEANAGLKQFYPDNASLVYDSSIGFTMDIRKYENPWGLYICNPNRAGKAFRTLLLPPKTKEVLVTPPQKIVLKDYSKTETFKCEAREKFYMTISGNFIPTINYEKNENSEFHFVATIDITRPENFSNHTIITCTSVQGKRELHRWEYTTYQERKMKFSYDEQLKSFLCCIDSVELPEMFLVPMCSSIMECQIQKHCTKTKKYPCIEKSNETVIGVPSGCTAFPIHTDTGRHNGMFVCSVGEFEDEDRIQKEFYFSFTKDKPVMNFEDTSISTEDILKITKVHNGSIYVNEEVEVSCTPNRFFFSKEYLWAFRRKNGTVQLVSKDLLKETLVTNVGLLPPTKAHTIIFPDSDITELICFAPIWNSATEWRNTTISVTILNDE